MKLSFDIKKYLNPVSAIGGMEVSDLALRLVINEDGRLRQASVQLPPGIINGGKLLDKAKMAAALKGLHLQIAPMSKMIHVILLIPTNNVYTQAFAMPLVAEKNIRETARLNLQSISPLDINAAYYDHQMIGENKKGQLEALGAFVNSQEVDELSAALKEARFNPVAVEFPALAVTRLIRNYGAGLKKEAPYLVAYLGSDGPDLMVIKNGHLYFNYFNSWAALQQEIGGRQIGSADVQEFLTRNIKQVMNFYTSRWGEPIQNVLLVDSPIAKDINQTIRSSFGLEIQPFQVSKYGAISPLWYAAIGALERGLVPRAKDSDISLTAIGVEQEYYRELALGFIRSWRNIFAGMIAFMLVALLVSDSFLVSAISAGEKDLAGRVLVSIEEIRALQDDVLKFNKAVDYAIAAQNATPAWSGFYAKMRVLTGTQISLSRIYVEPNLSGLLIGKAVSDSAVIAFKNALSKEANFKDVALPLSNIKVNEDGSVAFSLNFKISSLKF